MIDLHCHLLPGVDDGSRTVEQSVRVLELMAAGGVTAVCLTPHHSVSRIPLGIPAAHDRAFEALRARAPRAVALHRGVELMLDRPVTAELLTHPGLTLGSSRFVLVEFPRLVAASAAASALRAVGQLGFTPLLAHPERYRECRPDTAALWKTAGAVLQVDATTLLTGRGRGFRARELIAHGLGDIIAADNHGDDRMLGAGYRFLCEQGGEHQADLLARKNPAAILDGGELAPVPPLPVKTALLDRLRHLMGEEE